MSMSEKPKRGRPSHQWNEKDAVLVEVMTGAQMTQERIASIIGISEPTLRLHYVTEIERGSAKLEAQLVGNVLKIANGTGTAALKANEFLLRTRFGYSEYSPAPAEPKPPKLGKKEIANAEAQVAHEESDWADLVH
jgi:hypothetical protein